MKASVLSILALAFPIHAATGDWATAYTKAKAALAKLSTQNKVDMVTGGGWEKGPCVGNTIAISAIGYPALCTQDGPLGYVWIQKFKVTY
jgi:beta-glucosidase